MSDDRDFTPKLGKIRSTGSKRGRGYLGRVLQAVALAGGVHGLKKGKFTGSHTGRGAGAASVLGGRDRYAAYRHRRVTVKARFVKLKGKGLKAAHAHFRYIQRDGVTREGTPGHLYDAAEDKADGKAFLGRGEGDRHQFRFIVSAEDAENYEDLKPFVRRLMDRMEEDLGTKLDWVAVDHFNTGHPHTHIVVAGRDDRGKDLVIARDYISQGIRERAAEIVTFDFGPRTDLEVEHKLHREMEQERFTSLDARLLEEADDGHLVRPLVDAKSALQQTLRAGRLQKLKRLGLAEETQPGTWRLTENLEHRLRELGVRGDIIKTMHRELGEKTRSAIPADYAIYDPQAADARTIVGQVIAKGLSDEIQDRQYLIVSGTDGYSHYVDIGNADDPDAVRTGSIVAVAPKPTEPRTVDRTVAEIAAVNGGRYDVDIHLRHDPTSTATFAETHVRRLEAIRRTTGGVQRTPEGTWIIAPDHLERATAYEQAKATRAPVVVEVLSKLSVAQQIGADGTTWLDQELMSDAPTPLRDSGFGREARNALGRRRLWLMEQELARQDGDQVVYRANLLAVLRRREVVRVAAQMSDDLGLHFTEARDGQRLQGIYRKPIDLTSGRFAVIETQGKSFTLVPWRSVLDRNIGREVSGLVRGEGISWTVGRARGLQR
ncbi:MAG: relaxase/mobilization nuclease and DUF3363 domain-containing protein [Rhodospirillaceae bacterium]|nr:relaxase/mobilization nuclease and DUF3363 domain-containing protein [Rhodospirillaceae bacterium]